MKFTREYVIDKFYECGSSKVGEFMHIYPKILANLLNEARSRDKKIVILEIGNRNYETMIALLSMSEDIFMYGIDVSNQSDWNQKQRDLLLSKYGKRVLLITGSQDDKQLLSKVCTHALSNFEGFDLVIDDGSHKSSHVLTSFDVISAFMKEEGVYVVEDIECIYPGYLPEKLDPSEFWRYPDTYRSMTLRRFIQKLTDVVNRDFLQRSRLANFNKQSNIPRRAKHTLGNYTLLGRDDLIASYQVFTNCLVMYFGYHLTKPQEQGGIDPRQRQLIF